MLFPPVYLKTTKMQAPIKMVTPQPPPKEVTPPPPQPQIEESPPLKSNIPLLICGPHFTAVLPKEATRDVLAGKIDFFLVDERGVTSFKKKHIFAALKLDRKHVERYEDFPCLGAHERVLERRPLVRSGLGYRRRYISPELIGKGVYVRLFD